MVNEKMVISATSALDKLLTQIVEENDMPFMMAGTKDDSLVVIKFSEEGKSIFNVQDALELRDSGFEGRVDPSILNAPNLSENLRGKLEKIFGYIPADPVETETTKKVSPKVSINSPITLTRRIMVHVTDDEMDPIERALLRILMETMEEVIEELTVKDPILYNSIEETLTKMLEALENRGDSFDGKLRKLLVKQLIGLDLLRLSLLM